VSPRRISNTLVQESSALHKEDRIDRAVGRIIESELPALPVVDDRRRLCGIFGEREFMAALFPGYVRQLGYAGFVPRKLDDALAKRATCAAEPIAKYMNTEHIDVSEDFSNLEVAETFLHHPVLILPVTRKRQVIGVITRADFFYRLGTRFLEHDDAA
jgi:CBS-domain-containing membrane protein